MEQMALEQRVLHQILEQAPHRTVEALKAADRVSTSGSKLLVADYDGFHASQGDLTIPPIDQARQKSYGEGFKLASISAATACAVPTGARERELVQPLTKDWLQRCLEIENVSSVMTVHEEMGYHVTDVHTKQFFHGFADKVAFPSDQFHLWDQSRPNSKTVLTYDCPIPVLGVWEDKGVGIELSKEAKAELMSEMKGFHEAVFRTRGIELNQLGGLLINLSETDAVTGFLPNCVCVLMHRRRDGWSWKESPVLTGVSAVSNAIHWWIGLLAEQLAFIKKAEAEQIVPVADSTMHSAGDDIDDDDDNHAEDGRDLEGGGFATPSGQSANVPAHSVAFLMNRHVKKPIDHEAEVKKRQIISFVHGNQRIYC